MPGAGKINFFFNAYFKIEGCDGQALLPIAAPAIRKDGTGTLIGIVAV